MLPPTWTAMADRSLNRPPWHPGTPGLSILPKNSRTPVVVPHSNSTSNHNKGGQYYYDIELFLIPILHQTTTLVNNTSRWSSLFLIPILHQTTTGYFAWRYVERLFLIPILHQTTTTTYDLYTGERLFLIPILHQTTTCMRSCLSMHRLFLIPILHQTTTIFIPERI